MPKFAHSFVLSKFKSVHFFDMFPVNSVYVGSETVKLGKFKKRRFKKKSDLLFICKCEKYINFVEFYSRRSPSIWTVKCKERQITFGRLSIETATDAWNTNEKCWVFLDWVRVKYPHISEKKNAWKLGGIWIAKWENAPFGGKKKRLIHRWCTCYCHL